MSQQVSQPMSQAYAEVPVLVGVAHASERLGEDTYEALSPVDLAARAAASAIADTGAEVGVRALLDVVACTRQFDESFPGMPAPLGRSDNFPRSVAARLDVDPERVIYEVSGGQSPQHLVTELLRRPGCGPLADGAGVRRRRRSRRCSTSPDGTTSPTSPSTSRGRTAIGARGSRDSPRATRPGTG